MKLPNSIPLCVDLDGTFITQDVTKIAVIKALQHHWFNCLKIVGWFVQGGRSRVKYRLAQLYSFQTNEITIHSQLYMFLCQQQAQGRRIVLATGAPAQYAKMIIQTYPIFTDYVASSKNFNCISANKAHLLIEKYGYKGFDYIGNSRQDIAVWKVCRTPIAINCSLALRRKICKIFGNTLQFFDDIH